MPPSLENVLHKARNSLLDLSLRNRLLNTPRTATRSKRLDIVDERSDEVFRILVRDKRTMTFLASKEDADAESMTSRPVPQLFADAAPEGGESETGSVADRHVDTRLQTALTPDNLQKRLLSLHTDARTLEEEQGVSILYLALGFLEWYESTASDLPRYAPPSCWSPSSSNGRT